MEKKQYMIKKWKKISSKKVFDHPRHSVYIDEVELPDGKKTEYVIFGDPCDSTMVIGKRDDGMFLLQKEYSYPPDEIMFQFPGGKINTGESPELGALREFMEEGGFSGTLTKLGWTYLDNRRSSNKLHIYLAENLIPNKINGDDEEFLEDYWLTEEDIDDFIAKNEINNNTALAGWALYKARNRSN
jgi:ADP-ribose pyrophosphatase